MNCPACARPVAMARPTCMYCGSPLPQDVREEAALAAKRVMQSKSLVSLERAAAGPDRSRPSRRYVVINVSIDKPAETIAQGCGVSIWEARQWQAASPYRLLRISDEPANGATETALRESGLAFFVVAEEAVTRSRNPVRVESIHATADSVLCTIRDDEEAPPARKTFSRDDVVLIVSGLIRREKVKEQVLRRPPVETRLEDAWLVHFHLKTDERPWEIDPGRTAFEGEGLASANMRTLDLVRSFSTTVPYDEAFKNIVPALTPAADPRSELSAFKRDPQAPKKELKIVVLDNSGQFKEYSAWRGRVEMMRRLNQSGRSE